MSQARIAQVPAAPPPPAGAPGAPAIAGVPGVTFVPAGALSARDVAALRARASELSNQLRSATNSRSEVQRQLRRATGADKAGLEQRLGVLDARIARLEGTIEENGTQLASLAASRTAGSQPAFPGDNFSRNRAMDNLVPIVIVFTLFVLSPIAVSISRMFWKRGSMPKHSVQSPENAQRLERMEQAIDSIAIEIERVSEGQRFVTRLMSDRQNALGAAQAPAQPIAIPVGETVGTPR
ncbi:hypothetical protein BH11GEM2_BH11GEM2_36140 [soil metagenome]